MSDDGEFAAIIQQGGEQVNDSRAITVVQRGGKDRSSVGRVLETGRELGFELNVIGRSYTPVVLQRVGDWWIEPLSGQTTLTPRARQRLDALLAAGVRPKAVVVFHEIEQQPRNQPTTSILRAARSVARPLPTLAYQTVMATAAHLPLIGRFALKVAMWSVVGVGAVALAVVSVIGSDPCLVIVTEDGYWIEVDRWNS